MFSVLAMLGQHRHPDYWLPDRELAPDDPDEEARPTGRHHVASPRGSTPGLQAREASRDLFAQRRAAARGDAPPPEAKPPSAGAAQVASMLTGGRVTSGD